MSQRTRILIALLAIVVMVGGVLGGDLIRRSQQAAARPDLPPGAIPIYMDGSLVAGFVPDDLNQLEEVSFVDAEEGKTQQGWLLRDVLMLTLDGVALDPGTTIIVSSSSRGKSASMVWAEVNDVENMVMFDVSGRGTLKLVSRGLERLDVRDEWVQDVDRIEIVSS
ncbi:MAG TPA: hypothetical protein PK801_11795 [Aggregatilineales bacterium]|nr:hypothetical protein [Aggregatilineales bacterium]HPV07305.1 hypothetical protein [Aggregatilineales bacterium]HQA69000.1 hypothetical protein [Aggregatilineales bacterium]